MISNKVLKAQLLAAALIASASVSFAKPAKEFNSKIVGGVEASVGEFPFIVSLHRTTSHFCGGSLIAPDWVLTAAHCVTGTRQLKVVLGLHDQKNTQHAEMIQSKRIIAHPSYNSGTMDWDYALIQLERPSALQPIALNQGEIDIDQDAYPTVVAGWGTTKEGSWGLPNLLQKVEVPLVTRAACNASASYNNQITERMICAGYKTGGKDSCQGDSGGPLIAETPNRDRVLIGVVSWGIGCARPDKYGVYSNVKEAVSWIHTTMSTPN